MKTVLGFSDFRDEERVIIIVRHHWWVLFRDIVGLAILFILPFFLLPIAYAIETQGGGVSAVQGSVLFFFASAWTLVIWNLLFARWTDFYYDIWIITNWRIIDINQKGFFHREISTLLTLDHIEDIEATVSGIIGSVLNFGHVQVQTAAAKDVFDIDDVPNPPGVDQMIRAAQEEQLRVFGESSRSQERNIFQSAMAPESPGAGPSYS